MCGGICNSEFKINEFITESRLGRTVQKAIGNWTAQCHLGSLCPHPTPETAHTLDDLGKSVSTHYLLQKEKDQDIQGWHVNA